MIRSVAASAIFILQTTVAAWAQEGLLRSEQNLPGGGRNVSQCFTPPYCSDSKRNDAGELINMDYFTAKDETETTHLLNLVEIAHTNKVLSQISKNDYGGALNDIKYTLNRFPNHPRGLVLIGVYARFTKSYGLPVPYYEKAIRLFPQHALTHAQYGAYIIALGSLEAGIKKLHQAVEMNPQLVFAYVWLAAAYYKIDNVELGRQSESKARDLGYKGKISLENMQNTEAGK